MKSIPLVLGGKAIGLHKSLSDSADCNSWIIDAFNRMGFGLFCEGQSAGRVLDRNRHILRGSDGLAGIVSDPPLNGATDSRQNHDEYRHNINLYN